MPIKGVGGAFLFPLFTPSDLIAPMKISDAIDGYWLDKRLDFSDHTVTGYSVTFRRLIDYLQDKDIEQVTSNDIRRFLAYVAAEYELSPKSLSNVWTALSSLWSWAEKELGIAHPIKGKVKRPRYSKPVVEPFTQDDIKALLKSADQDRHKAIILTLLDSGSRAQERCD